MSSAVTTRHTVVRIDRDAELRMLGHFGSDDVDKVLEQAAQAGAKAAAAVLKSEAPIGTAQRLGQYYRAQGWGHGTLRSSVRAAAIRQRGSGIRGYKAGPIGSKAFTRHWVELGTRYAKGKHWVESAASAAFSVAKDASEAVLTLYARNS